MLNVLFVAIVGACLFSAMAWAFKTLPHERWQILATVPVRKRQGHWEGVNLTYYGLLTASSGVFAILIFLLLMAAIEVSLALALSAVVVLLLASLPAAKLVARIVDRKEHTLTVAGAVFVGMLIAPFVLAALNFVRPDGASPMPLIGTMAALAIAHALGEGLGRLACISFGCCYGKPIREIDGRARRLFERFHFAFHGKTKKIAYASNLEGVAVLPVQALTAVFYVSVALISTLLFLESHFRAAFLLTVLCSQAWRIYSETLRADHRGGFERWSSYQVMAAVGMLYAVGLAWTWPVSEAGRADLVAGLSALWNPIVILALQIVWGVLFLFSGWSMVTGSVLSFHVRRDRI